MNTPLNKLHNYTNTTECFGYLPHKNTGNTIIGIYNAAPGVKISGGWRFNDRDIKFEEDPTMSWHQNGALAGLVVQPIASSVSI